MPGMNNVPFSLPSTASTRRRKDRNCSNHNMSDSLTTNMANSLCFFHGQFHNATIASLDFSKGDGVSSLVQDELNS